MWGVIVSDAFYAKNIGRPGLAWRTLRQVVARLCREAA